MKKPKHHASNADYSLLSGTEHAAQINLDIARESLRHVHHSFNLAKRSFQLNMLMTAAFALFGLYGLFVCLDGRIPEGATTTFGGITSSAVFSQLSKSARDQLDKANARLDTIRYDLWDGELTAIFTPIIQDIHRHSDAQQPSTYVH